MKVRSLFQGAAGLTHRQCIGESHQTRNCRVEEEVLCEVRGHLEIQVTQAQSRLMLLMWTKRRLQPARLSLQMSRSIGICKK